MKHLTGLVLLLFALFLVAPADSAPVADVLTIVSRAGLAGGIVRVRSCTAVVPHPAARVAVVYDVVVPYDVRVLPVAVNPDYYYSLAAYHRYNLLLGAGGATRPPTATPETPPAPRPLGGASEKLKTIVSTTCLKCHQGEKPKGGLNLENLDSLPEVERWRIHNRVHKGEMPPGGPPVPDADMPEFLNYAEAARAALKK